MTEQRPRAGPGVAQDRAVLQCLRRVGEVGRAEADAAFRHVADGRVLELHEELVGIALHAHAELELVADEVVPEVRIALVRCGREPIDELAAHPVVQLDPDGAAERTVGHERRNDAPAGKREPRLVGPPRDRRHDGDDDTDRERADPVPHATDHAFSGGPHRHPRSVVRTDAGDLVPNPLRAAVDVEATVANEAEERHVGVAREIGGEARRGPDGGENRNARRERLLHELVAGAPAHEDQALAERHRPRQPLRPDHLVDRVVTADVLAHVEHVARRIEERRRVQAAGTVEHRLRRAYPVRKIVNRRAREDEAVGQARAGRGRQRLDRRLAAEAAARGGEEIALEQLGGDRHVGRELARAPDCGARADQRATRSSRRARRPDADGSALPRTGSRRRARRRTRAYAS